VIFNFQKAMILQIKVEGEETVEISVFSIRRVELMYYDMVQITLHDDSVKELHFSPVEKAQEQAKELYDILTRTITVNASYIKPLRSATL
jgi:hypothetical protein